MTKLNFFKFDYFLGRVKLLIYNNCLMQKFYFSPKSLKLNKIIKIFSLIINFTN